MDGAGWSLVIRSRFSNTICIYTLVILFVYIHVLHWILFLKMWKLWIAGLQY